jgi:hypothetical protein
MAVNPLVGEERLHLGRLALGDGSGSFLGNLLAVGPDDLTGELGT